MTTLITLIALTAALPFIFDYFTRSTPMPSLSFAGPMLSAMADVGAPSSAAPSADRDDDDDTNDFPPFDARELHNVADRVVTPFRILVGDDVVTVHGVNPPYRYSSSVDILDADRDVALVLDGGTMVELYGPVTVLDAPNGVKAYLGEGELLCAEHGAPFDIGLPDGAVSPIFEASHLDTVEYCSAGPDRGHSFCGACGTYVEPKGHPDSGFNGPLFVCDNCSTRAVCVEDSQISSSGYERVDGFDDLTTTYDVKVTLDAAQRVHPFGWSSVLDPKPTGTVDAVRDNSARRWTSTWGFVCYLDDSPEAGVLLNLSDTGMAAWEEAREYFEDEGHGPDTAHLEDEEADGAHADFHASLQAIRVRLADAVTITRK